MKRFLVLVTVSLLVIAATLISAQDSGILTYGTVIQGVVGADNAPTQYMFSGTAGDVVSIRVNGASTGMDPNVRLVGPSGETLAANDNLLAAFERSAVLTYRLPVSGNYTIIVSGTTGNYVLTLSLNEAATTTTRLEVGRPVGVVLPQPAGLQVYSFNTDPVNTTTLLIDANPLVVDAYLEVLDANGQQVALLRGDLDNACLSFGPGDQLNEVRIAAAPEIVGNVTLTLGRGPCIVGTQPPVPVVVPPFQVTPINGACTIGSSGNFNVRTGPGLQNAILVVWPAQQPLVVTGVSADGQWYSVLALGSPGWVARSVVIAAGPCNQVPIVTPTVSLTPDSTAEVTATVDPNVTPEVTAVVTVVPPTVPVPTTETTPEVTTVP